MNRTLLFDVERAAALLGAIGIAVLIARRGARGEWPIKFGNVVEYAPKQALTITAEALDKQDNRLRIAEDRLGIGQPDDR